MPLPYLYVRIEIIKAMRQFNFTTNIEHRMPTTGKVFCIDRMTSDWVERCPFNVDAFIMDVAQRHGADIGRVRLFFNYGLGKKGEKFSTHCPAKHRDKVKKDPKTGIGDLILGKFPEFVNGCEPALIEAWNKGAEYHTKGFRQGDTLPDILPMCKITRLDDGGWIALFPKDMHLLSEPSTEQEVVTTEARNEEITPEPEPLTEPKQEPKQLDLFAFSEKPKRKPKRRHAPVRRQQQPQAVATTVAVAAAVDSNTWLKTAGYLAAASVALLIIWQTGLIIPLGLIGLATGGLLK